MQSWLRQTARSRFQILGALLLFNFVLTIAACSAIGPTSSPEFPAFVAKAVPKEDGEVRFYGQGQYFPGLRGFTDVRSSLLGGQYQGIPGVVVITDTALLFEQWDSNTEKFDVVKRLPFSEVTAVTLDSYGLNRRLVLRKKDLSFETFNFTRAAGNSVDGDKVEQAFQLLDARFNKKTANQSPPAER
jgi:hypothetical protein